MTNIEQKALELVNEVRRERNQELWKDVGNRKGYGMVLETLCRAIERHEAFRQEVSDAVEKLSLYWERYEPSMVDFHVMFNSFIIPKPDPLAEALAECDGVTNFGPGYNDDARVLRAALAKRGLEIREKTND